MRATDWLIIIVDYCHYDIKILKTTKEKIGAVAFLMACIMGCFSWFRQNTSPMCSHLQPCFNQQWAFWNRCLFRFISLCLFTLSTFLIVDEFFRFYFLLWLYNPNLTNFKTNLWCISFFFFFFFQYCLPHPTQQSKCGIQLVAFVCLHSVHIKTMLKHLLMLAVESWLPRED